MAPATKRILATLKPGAVNMCGRTNGATALHLAVSWGQVSIAEVLLQAGAKSHPDKDGLLPHDLGCDAKPASLVCAEFVRKSP